MGGGLTLGATMNQWAAKGQEGDLLWERRRGTAGNVQAFRGASEWLRGMTWHHGRGTGVAGSDVAPQDVILASRGGGAAVGPDLAPRGVVLVLRGIGVAVGSDMAPWRWVSVMVSTQML